MSNGSPAAMQSTDGAAAAELVASDCCCSCSSARLHCSSTRIALLFCLRDQLHRLTAVLRLSDVCSHSRHSLSSTRPPAAAVSADPSTPTARSDRSSGVSDRSDSRRSRARPHPDSAAADDQQLQVVRGAAPDDSDGQQSAGAGTSAAVASGVQPRARTVRTAQKAATIAALSQPAWAARHR